MSDLTTGTAHGKCMAAGEHICQKPSGRRCHDQPCDEPAGTDWGPHWCPAHDKERIDRISGQMENIMAESLAINTRLGLRLSADAAPGGES